MKKYFDIGDIVVIRDWDDMEAEFGLDGNGYIACKYTFTRDMKYLCGLEYEVFGSEERSRHWLKPHGHEKKVESTWAISTDMLVLKSEIENDLPSIDPDALSALLFPAEVPV